MNKKEFIEIIKPLVKSLNIQNYKEKYNEWVIKNPNTDRLNFPIAYKGAFPNISVYRDGTINIEYNHQLKNGYYKKFVYNLTK